MHISALAAAVLAVAPSLLPVFAIPKVTRSGRYLYTEDGNRFYIKGIAYQEQGEVVPGPGNDFLEPSTFFDPLSDGDACNRDVPFLRDMGVNTVRVYSVNSSLNHDTCMTAFSNAGIYTVIDLSLPLNGSIDRESPSWSTNILNQYIHTIDVFAKYDNVLAYNVGNEVILGNITGVAPYVKAAARDTKAYLKSKNLDILVGYASIDGSAEFRDPLANYFTCDPDNANSDATAIDLYGLNNYRWCGDESFETAYASTNADYANYNVAAYFSEYGMVGCGTRPWSEVPVLFGEQMTPIWSGGIAFSYFPARSAAGEFGMVTISADGKSVQTSQDYDNLKQRYNAITFVNEPTRASAAASTYGTCPATNSTFQASTKLPPTPNDAACSCLVQTLSCQFTPKTSNYSVIVGELIGLGCSFLGSKGQNCNEIGGDGVTGTYGRLSGCDPTIKLSYVMSKFYESENRNAQACSFSGNGTVNPNAPTSASAADAAASSCISNPTATFVPSAPATTAGPGGTSKPTNSQGGNNGNGALFLHGDASMGIVIMTLTAVLSAVFTLV